MIELIILIIGYKIIKHIIKEKKRILIKTQTYYYGDTNKIELEAEKKQFENNKLKNKNIDEYRINYYKNTNEKYNNTEKWKNYYEPKRYITTLNELNFYTTLIEIAKELNLILFAQVSLYSIIVTKENLNFKTRQTYMNKINRKSIDFVLVNKENCRIKLCIELDDQTHYRKKRKERDNFINELFKELKIPLLRYPSYTVYYKEPLKKKILENIKDTYYE